MRSNLLTQSEHKALLNKFLSLRSSRKLSIYDLADQVGLPKSTLHDFKTKKHRPTQKTASAIREYLRAKAQDL